MNRKNAFTGALVADAASMGLHWLYDQEQIRLIETTGSLLFRQPERAVYENKRGSFVHGSRRAGQLSHYGESARIAGRLALQGDYSIANHQQAFMASFGPCGSFQGYADRPTKHLIGRMLLDGDALIEPSGMDDNQMPALCVVPGLFAAELSVSDIQKAVSVVSTNKGVLHAAEAVHSALSQLAAGADLKAALEMSAADVAGELGEKMLEAINKHAYEPLQAAQHFGPACYVDHALPLSWHLLYHATDFEAVVLDSVRCGGDCCGRAMALGSIAGMAFGVPDEMRQQTSISLDNYSDN